MYFLTLGYSGVACFVKDHGKKKSQASISDFFSGGGKKKAKDKVVEGTGEKTAEEKSPGTSSGSVDGLQIDNVTYGMG